MSDAVTAAPHHLALFDFERARLQRIAEDRRFVFWLALTVFVHALMLVGFNAAEPRRLGSPGGATDAISVSLVSSADLDGRATVEDQAAGVLAPPPPPVAEPQNTPPEEATPPAETPPAQEPAPPEPAAKAEAVPKPQPEPQLVTEPQPAPEKAAEPAAEKAKPNEERAEVSPEALTLPDASEIPAPKALDLEPPKAAKLEEAFALDVDKPEKKEKPKKAEPVEQPKTPREETAKKKQSPAEQKLAKLDLSPPVVFQAPVGGGGAGVQRPAGITRSGENDAFARGVIRALQRTMPQLSDTRGRVTVRITVDRNGNLVNTEVLRPSTAAGLDQSVVFATRQSSFPFPPANAKDVDLVFIVTYIYR